MGVEQEKLFKEILNISNSTLDAIKVKNYQDGLKQGHNEGLMMGWENGIKNIKKLNWFRRLFKLF